jgi:hypothetical protein
VPFTPSHAVVALPFARTRLVPAAIAVGAMTPDLPLFVRGTPLTYAMTHDLWRLPLATAVALILLLVWRLILRPAASGLAPRFVAERLPPEWDVGARATVRETFPSATGTCLLVASLALGVVSHIAWDAMTHEGRGGVALVPALAEIWGPLPGYRWLQYASGAAGLIILGVWAARELLRRPRRNQPARTSAVVRVAWWLSLPLTLGTAWLWGWAAYGPLTAEFTMAHLAYRVLPPACGWWGAATLILCLSVARHARGAARFEGPRSHT